MMKQMKHIIFSILFMTTVFLTGCDSILGDENAITNPQATMEVDVMGVSESSGVSGTLIFWKKEMNDFFIDQIANLNEFKDTKYNTGESYPIDNSEVSATGFSPANMQYSKAAKYQTLTLPAGSKPGTIDVCAATTIINGRYTAPFNEKLSFEHTLTKITFYAQRHETMVGSRNVRNIIITVPKSYVPTQWDWNADKYAVNYTKNATEDLKFEHPSILFETSTEKIGVAYLMLPTNNKGVLENINVKAEIIPIYGTTVETTIDTTLPIIQLYDTDSKTEIDHAEPGEAYEIVVSFQQNSFTLIARQQDDWEKGGLIYVPVKP